MLHKQFALLETKTDGESGEFTAIVSTFGNVDRVGDRIMPGAWTKSLEQWAASGDPIPIILAHQWDDPMAHIGVANAHDVKQVPQGLQVTAKLDVEDNPVAKQVYKLLKRRSLKEFSIGYDVPKGGEYRAKDGANEITEINLAECGPCLKGIDPKTELQAVKSALHGVPEPDEQREQAKRVEREAEEDQIPVVPEQPQAPAEPEVDLGKELQEVKAQLEELRGRLDDQEKKAKPTDQEAETKSRSVDSLRQQADAVALEQASGGQSLLKPPHKATPKPPELIPMGVLKQRMRDEMLARLSEGIPDEQV